MPKKFYSDFFRKIFVKYFVKATDVPVNSNIKKV